MTQRRALQILFGCLIVAGLSLTLYPFVPRITYALGIRKVMVAPTTEHALAALPFTQTEANSPALLPDPLVREQRLRIPKIGVDMPIVEGESETALERGAWHLPGTARNPEQGNFVLAGHRFRYAPPSSMTMYLLDKVAVGDPFIVTWQGKELRYRVVSTKIVAPTAVEVLAQTERPRITLITCTPLFSTAKRLVVVGEQTT